MKTEKLMYTVSEACSLLGICRTAIYAAVNSGEVPSMRIGRRLLVPKAAFHEKFGSLTPTKEKPMQKQIPRKIWLKFSTQFGSGNWADVIEHSVEKPKQNLTGSDYEWRECIVG